VRDPKYGDFLDLGPNKIIHCDTNITELIKLIDGGSLSIFQLTFVAEELANVSNSNLVVPCLLKLLNHSESLVREGAVYGLEGHLEYPGVIESLVKISTEDPREGVRLAASEALD
jgi:hypothetical protein